jgi:uncharacterized membrane protein (UPF0182 family)
MRPAQRPRIRRRWIIIAAIVLIAFISISSVVRFYTDLLWFHEVGFAKVFWKIIWTRVGIGTVGGVLAGLVIFANLEVARRAAPRYRFVTAGSDLTEQYRSAFRPYARVANLAMSAVVAFFTGLSTSAAWQRYLLWKNAVPFGIHAPRPFGHDVAFYVFSIPFQRAVLSWLFGVLVVSLLLAGVAHLFNGSIQPETNRVRVGTIVKAHVSVLFGLIALLKAWAYRLDVYDLVFSPRGVVTGASYTDVHVQRKAIQLLLVIAVVAAIIFFVNVFRFQGWVLPGAAIGIWLFASILLGGIVPAAVQRFEVKPNESQKERPYIKRNIAATRDAFNLNRIDIKTFTPQNTLPASTVAANQGTIRNVRVWDPTVLLPTYQRLQAIRSYYTFNDVDIDRYNIDGQQTQVMLSGREVDATKLDPGTRNWVNTRLTYTHGYGFVANPANSLTSEGLPNFLVQDLPPTAPKELSSQQPGLYYGEELPAGSYSVVRTKQAEIDYPKGEQQVISTHYNGSGGIPMTNYLRRLAFAIRFGDTDLLVSNFITPQSRMVMRRNIVERVQAAAPFLQYDSDPYLVATKGKLYWIMDGYTTTDRYPYAQRMDLGAQGVGNLQGVANYMRNSVKVVIDAYNGTTKFYIVDPTDPLVETYQKTFPELFTAISKLPADLASHLRYPEDMFKVQALQYRAYHITDPQRLYSREDVWDIANDPVHSTGNTNISMDPYYVILKLPGETKEEFVLMLPFTPKGKPNLNGWMAARMDPGHYGQMVAFSFPRGAQIEGPENISARINQNDKISQQFTLWDQAGSSVIHGNILVIPVGHTLLYVQPIYLAAQEESHALPELRRVITVVGNGAIGFEPTFNQSLEDVMNGQTTLPQPTTSTGTPSTTPSTTPSNVGDLLAQAMQHFQNADNALKNGDLATYQKEDQAGRADVQQAQQAASK